MVEKTNTSGTFVRDHWLWGSFYQNKSIYMQVGLAAAFVNMLSLTSSLFIMTVYDRVVPNNAIESLIALSIGMAIALSADFILKTLRGYFIDVAGQRLDYEIGSSLFRRVLDLKLAERKGSSGAFASVIREFETLKEFFTSATLVAFVDLPFIFLFLGVIAIIAGQVAWVPILAVPIVIVTGFLIQPALAKLASQGLSDGQSKHGVLVETIAGLETVKSLGAGAMLEQRWRSGLKNHSTTSRRSRIITQFAVNVAGSVQQIAQVGTVIVGVFLISSGDLTVGGLIAAVILTGRALAPLAQLAQVLSRANGALSSYKTLDSLMQQGGETDADRSYLRRAKMDGKIEFKDVVFRYPGQTGRAMDSVSFTIEPGEKVAVLGKIGSGKSTITRLILGLYEPDEGSVLVDDTDIRQIMPSDLRQNIGSVLQDIYLFSGSIRDNITLGHGDIADDELLRVAKLGGVHDFAGQLAAGYDLKLMDRGEGLSGGQKQSIAIARALAGKPPILLMDEPSSAMDTGSENALLARLEEEVKDRTLVLITHRASLLKLVDKVIVFDKGRIIAQGPKDDVLKAMAAESARRANQ